MAIGFFHTHTVSGKRGKQSYRLTFRLPLTLTAPTLSFWPFSCSCFFFLAIRTRLTKLSISISISIYLCYGVTNQDLSLSWLSLSLSLSLHNIYTMYAYARYAPHPTPTSYILHPTGKKVSVSVSGPVDSTSSSSKLNS